MKKLTTVLLTSFMLFGAVACQNPAKTSESAPGNTNETAQSPDVDTSKTNQSDATSETRKEQIESDIRAREQRNDAGGDDAKRNEGDIESEVRDKLEANIPASQLAVEGDKDGAVTISGTVPTQQQLDKIEPLAKEIKGVTQVTVKATVAPTKTQ